jgi:DNA repair exonuclease SbcCD ATPase subunit
MKSKSATNKSRLEEIDELLVANTEAAGQLFRERVELTEERFREVKRRERRERAEALTAGYLAAAAEADGEADELLPHVSALRAEGRALVDCKSDLEQVGAEISDLQATFDELGKQKAQAVYAIRPEKEIRRLDAKIAKTGRRIEQAEGRAAELREQLVRGEGLLAEADRLERRISELGEVAVEARAAAERVPEDEAALALRDREHKQHLRGPVKLERRPTAIVLGMPDAAEIGPGLVALADGSTVNTRTGARFWMR